MNGIISFFEGMGTGVLLSLMLGTVFFALINNSVNHGFKTGLSVAVGVIISDVIFISFCIFGSQFIPKIQSYELQIKAIGGSLVILLGISQLVRKSGVSKVQRFSKAGSITFFVSQGFLLNFLNPVNLVSWFAINTYLISALDFNKWQLVNFFAGCLIAIFLMEALLAYSAHRVKKHLKDKTIYIMNKTIGGLFIALGAWLILR
jgi:threonine/homoserine/homoserine lactone efflux protein